MPELPEVETSKRYIEQFLLNAKILNIQSSVSKLRWEIHPDINFFFNNTIILKIDRIGKYILINTSNKNTLILHLGMSGYLSIKEANFKKVKHDHIIINFEGITGEKKCLIFNDQRRFGHIDFHYTSNLKKHFLIKNLGIDGLSKSIKYEFLKKIFSKKSIIIKSALLDQKIICGIGNIYASEILFDAKISPLAAGKDLNISLIVKLIRSIRRILNKAIKYGGSSISDYRSTNGTLGNFQSVFKVYGKEGTKIKNDQVIKIVQYGRSTFYCPKVQNN